MALHEANRVKLAEMMPKGSCGVALLQGGDQQTRYDTDHEPVFRQESYFQYLFGVSEAGCFGAVSLPRSAHALHRLCTRCTLSPHPLRTLSAVRAPRSSCRSWAKSTRSSAAATRRQRRSRPPMAWRRCTGCTGCPRGLAPPLPPPPPAPLPLPRQTSWLMKARFPRSCATTAPAWSRYERDRVARHAPLGGPFCVKCANALVLEHPTGGLEAHVL